MQYIERLFTLQIWMAGVEHSNSLRERDVLTLY